MKLPLGASWTGVGAFTFAILVGSLLGAAALSPIVDESWPAWVQAVGSVVAIFIAVIVPNRIAARERQARELQWKFRAKSYAFVLHPIINSMTTGLRTAQARWRSTPEQYDDDDVTEYLSIPAALASHMLNLHEIGEAGLAIQDVIIATTRLKEGVHYQYAHWRYAGMYFDPHTGDEEEMPEPENVDTLFGVAEEKASIAIAALNNVLSS